MSTRALIRNSLQELLEGFLAAPLQNAREYDYQCVLFGILRRRFPHPVPIALAIPGGRAPHAWVDPLTSRVHAEMSIGSKGKAGQSVKPDLVVLRDATVTLPCSVDGPTDVQETLRLEDVDAAIEIKSAPSANATEALKFAKDISKLLSLQEKKPEAHCFLLVIDKSLSLPSARSSRSRPTDWLARARDCERHDLEPPVPFVEVWYLDGEPKAPRQAFFSKANLTVFP